jgi:extracellular factor (EF) 3-hydroxypalmitic acid methyl ester biosynthesis protein
LILSLRKLTYSCIFAPDMKEFRDLKELLLNLVEIHIQTDEETCLNLLQEKLDVISNYRKSLSLEEDEKYKRAFRKFENLLDLLHECPFGKYVNDKPRGFPGDFVTQEMIILGRNYSDHQNLGTTPLGKLLSLLTYRMAACAANEYRLDFIKHHIAGSGKALASIGSGSGIEYWDMDQKFLKSLDVFLLDMDEGALGSAIYHIPVNSNFRFYQANLLKFILGKDKDEIMGTRELIYLLGLLDYFPVKQSSRIVSKLWENVKPGGKMILTNAHPSNPTRLWMEYVSEWYLIYKTREEMMLIVENLKDVLKMEYLLDKFSVYQYIIVTKIK